LKNKLREAYLRRLSDAKRAKDALAAKNEAIRAAEARARAQRLRARQHARHLKNKVAYARQRANDAQQGKAVAEKKAAHLVKNQGTEVHHIRKLKRLLVWTNRHMKKEQAKAKHRRKVIKEATTAAIARGREIRKLKKMLKKDVKYRQEAQKKAKRRKRALQKAKDATTVPQNV